MLGGLPHHLLPHHTVHTQAARDDGVAGRGLLIAARQSLNLSVRPWCPNFGKSGAIWLQVCHPQSAVPYFVGACYFAPPGSTQWDPQTPEKTPDYRFGVLARELAAARASGEVLLGGDFNAVVGEGESGRPDLHGAKLLSFCEECDVTLCTGTAPGDEAALPTRHPRLRQPGGPRRLDHLVASAGAFDSIISCTVPRVTRSGTEHRRDSDHQPILVRLKPFLSAATVPAADLSGCPLHIIPFD